MAFVLPGGAPEFRRGDLEGTLRRVCGYERELQENLNFCLGQLSKALDRANGGVEEAAVGREALAGRVAAAEAAVKRLESRLAALESGKEGT